MESVILDTSRVKIAINRLTLEDLGLDCPLAISSPTTSGLARIGFGSASQPRDTLVPSPHVDGIWLQTFTSLRTIGGELLKHLLPGKMHRFVIKCGLANFRTLPPSAKHHLTRPKP